MMNMNPQQLIQMMIQQNPQLASMLNGVNFNDSRSVENVCKNICRQKGLDYNTMVAKFKQQGGKL